GFAEASRQLRIGDRRRGREGSSLAGEFLFYALDMVQRCSPWSLPGNGTRRRCDFLSRIFERRPPLHVGRWPRHLETAKRSPTTAFLAYALIPIPTVPSAVLPA